MPIAALVLASSSVTENESKLQPNISSPTACSTATWPQRTREKYFCKSASTVCHISFDMCGLSLIADNVPTEPFLNAGSRFFQLLRCRLLQLKGAQQTAQCNVEVRRVAPGSPHASVLVEMHEAFILLAKCKCELRRKRCYHQVKKGHEQSSAQPTPDSLKRRGLRALSHTTRNDQIRSAPILFATEFVTRLPMQLHSSKPAHHALLEAGGREE